MAIIGPNPVHTMIASGQGWYGPFLYGGSYFVVLRGDSPYYSVYSKPISGSVWTAEAASPVAGAGENPGDTYFDGQKIWYLATTSSGSAQQVLYFDCGSRSWTIVTSPGGANLWITQNMAVFGLPDGNCMVFGTDAIPRNLGFYKITGGAWGSFTSLHTLDALSGIAGNVHGFGGAAISAAGTAHVIYSDLISISGTRTRFLYYRKVLSGGGISSEQVIASGTANPGVTGTFRPGDGSGITTAIYGNRVFVAQRNNSNVGFTCTSGAWVSSTIDDTLTNPTWTFYNGFTIPVDSDSQFILNSNFGWSQDARLRVFVDFGIDTGDGCANGNNNNYYIETDAPGSGLYLYCHGYQYDTDSNIVMDRLWASKWNGAGFDAGVMVIDYQITFPTSPPGACGPGGQGWGGGNASVFTSVEYTLIPPSIPLAISCGSGTGQIGVSYSDMLVASGGTAPYVYSLVSGTFPPGISLNPATGVISGIPTSSGNFPFTARVVDAISGAAQVACGITIVPLPPEPIIPPGPFEFYGMETPADVEILPVPKRYDQVGPVRFDKIGKIFGFRVRMIASGTTTIMPYKIYGDDSESLDHLNSPLFSDQFTVRPGLDNVYEIQLPKSVNTDICRMTFGPVDDPFYRYDVLIKVHISGMKGQAKWIPIR